MLYVLTYVYMYTCACVDARHWHWVMSWSGFFEVQFGKCWDTQNCTKNEGTLLLCGTGATEGSTIHQFTVVGLLLSLYLCVTRWVSCGWCSTFWSQACLELPPSGRSKLQWPDGDWSVHGENACCSRCVHMLSWPWMHSCVDLANISYI